MTDNARPAVARPGRRSPGRLPLAVAVFAAGALLAAGLLALFLVQTYRAAESSAEADTLATATLLGTRLEATLNRVRATANLVSRRMATGDWSPPRVVDGVVEPSRSLVDLGGDFPEVAGMAVFDAGGTLWLSSQPAPAGESIADRDYFKEAQARPARELRFAPPLQARISNRLVLPAYMPIVDGRGALRGVFVASIGLQALEAALEHVDVGAGGVVALRDSDDGSLVARYPPFASALHTRPSDLRLQEMTRRGTAGGTSRFVSVLDSVERIVSYQQVPGYPFYVAVGYATASVFAPWWRQAVVLVAGLCLALAAIALVLRRGLRQQRQQQVVDERYRSLVDGMGDAVCRIRPDGTLAFVNAAYRQHFERPGTDAVGSHFLDRVPEAARPAIRGAWESQPASSGRTVREVWETCADGVERCFQWQSWPQLDAAGNLVETQAVGRDVTELKRATRELGLTAERLALALDVAGIGWSDVDLANGVRTQSAQLSRMLGLEARETELTHDQWLQGVAPEDQARCEAAFERAKAVDEVVAVEHRRQVAGVPRWFLSAGRTVARAADGTAQRIVAVHLDITERKRAELQVQESEARLRMALEIGRQGWYEFDVANDGVVESPGWLRGLGYAPQSQPIPLDRWLECVHADDRQAIASRRAAVAAGGDPPPLEYRRRAADGSWRTVHSVGRVATRAPDGAPLRVVGMMTDVTERLQQEQALRESEHRYRVLAESGPAMMWTTGPDGRITYANHLIEAFTGLPRAQLLAGSTLACVHADDLAEYRAKFAVALAQRQPYEQDYRVRNAAGEWRWVHGSALPSFAVDGRFTGHIGHAIDITDARAATQELEQHRLRLEHLVEERTGELRRAKELAEAATVAKSAFLANMSHELRTPLNAITGMVHLLRREGMAPKQRERLAHIDRSSRHLLEVVNAVLELAKIDAGRLELHEQPLDLGSIAPSTVEMLAERAADKGLVVTVEQPVFFQRLLGDATRLREALLNYVGNAVKFTAAGVVIVRVGIVDETEDDVTVRFEVEDTGIGIAAADVPRLFRAFEQVDGSSTRRFGGTGLGLAITERLARHMGGQVGVTSTLGAGSTFWFTARLRKDTSAVHRAPPAPVADADEAIAEEFAGARILLVEDEPINLEVGVALLEAVGLAVDTATDGADAVERAGRQCYDLVLMDLQLPEFSGLEATERIRRLPACRDVPIIALTASAFVEDRVHCLAVGMNDFIAKPVEPAVLYQVVLRWLRLRRSQASRTLDREGCRN